MGCRVKRVALYLSDERTVPPVHLPAVIWSGLVVVDRHGNPVLWKGSLTPKLFHSEEQARVSLDAGQALEPVTMVMPKAAA